MAWYWAGDSKKGSQDKWIAYDDDMAEKLEKAYQANKKKVKIDDERFVDMSDRDNMLQRRYDDPKKQRDVKREDKKVDDEEEEEDDEKALWYWAGDPKKKNGPPQWIEYDEKVATKLEVAYRCKKTKIKIDDERFVDMSDRDDMSQRRYDDENKMRAVKREVTSATTTSSSAPSAKKLKTTPAATTTTTTSTGGRRQKNADNLKQLTAYEQQEYAMALDPRLSAFYSDSAGLNEELVEDKPANKKVKRDAHSNPSGAEFDLGRDGAFKGYTVLLGKFLGVNLGSPTDALKKKGFEVVEASSEADFLQKLPTADVAWIISGTDPNTKKKKTKTSSGESYPAWTTSTKKKFQDGVMKYHKDGGALFLWGDNDPLFEHANAILPLVMKDDSCVLVGNTPGGKVMKVGSATTTQEFGRHMLTSGVVSLYEGTTICYPENLGGMKVLATSSNGHPVICYVDHEFLDENCGRVLVDTGYTKNYISWDAAGTARYIINATVWLLGLEHKLLKGEEITSRVSRTKKSK